MDKYLIIIVRKEELSDSIKNNGVLNYKYNNKCNFSAPIKVNNKDYSIIFVGARGECDKKTVEDIIEKTKIEGEIIIFSHEYPGGTNIGCTSKTLQSLKNSKKITDFRLFSSADTSDNKETYFPLWLIEQINEKFDKQNLLTAWKDAPDWTEIMEQSKKKVVPVFVELKHQIRNLFEDIRIDLQGIEEAKDKKKYFEETLLKKKDDIIKGKKDKIVELLKQNNITIKNIETLFNEPPFKNIVDSLEKENYSKLPKFEDFNNWVDEIIKLIDEAEEQCQTQ